ncbi:hypothetical protein HMF8227_00055 [Saliniradius amylolyticus]|uniref:Uncharacterized protein n=1 Tax=Saliniradius amylolyticus TaxID=2183582 RepID=A0A2S2DYY8_9ALTE|nr:hypothetical protein [Saliniradius amylolyticus]AWL10563.1 hypothetical protein HMF8227_00055 [Saliniradius amylolyticus]
MIKLSRRGWNNVLIFACLLLILVFNQSADLISSGETSHTRLLPADTPVLRIDYGSHQLQRIGQGWRAQPSLGLEEQALAAIVNNWRNAEGETIPVNMEGGYVAVVWLAGEPNGRPFKLKSQGNDVLVKHQGQVIRLKNTPLSALLPEALH